MEKGSSSMSQGIKNGEKTFNPNAPAFIPSSYIHNPPTHNAKKSDKPKSSKFKKSQSKTTSQHSQFISQSESIDLAAKSLDSVLQLDPDDSTVNKDKKNQTNTGNGNNSWLNTDAPEFIPRQYDPGRYSDTTKGSDYQYPYFPYHYSYNHYQQPILVTPSLPQHQYIRVMQGREMFDHFYVYPGQSSVHPSNSIHSSTNNNHDKPQTSSHVDSLESQTNDLNNQKSTVTHESQTDNIDANENLDKALQDLSVAQIKSVSTNTNLSQSSKLSDDQNAVPDKPEIPEQINDSDKKDIAEETYSFPFDILSMISIGANLYKNNLIKKPFKFTDAKNSNDPKDYKKHKDGDIRSSKHDNYESKKLSGFFSCERYNDIDFIRSIQEQLPKPSETSWVAKQKLQKADDTIALVRRVKGLLNRLTYEKFDIIYSQLMQVGIFTMEQLKLLIDVVFEKAVTQHHFIPMYGELCSKIKKDIVIQGEVVDDSEKNNMVRRLLLDKCQNSFESNLKPMVLPPDLSEEESFEAEQKYKHRMRGNMMFVGELLKRKILAAKVLIACLDQVMQKRAECIAAGNIDRGNNHLEAMCTLLQTVGKSFDTCKWKHLPDLDKHLESLKVIGKDERVSFRIRCIIKNVLDSRNDKWEDRGAAKITEIPCKLDELRSKVQAETERSDKSSRAKNDKERSDRDIQRSVRSARLERPRNSNKAEKADKGDVDGKLAEAEFIMPKDVLKRRLVSIVSELAFSFDVNEANECISELNIPDSKIKTMLVMLFVGIVEKCAKVTMHKERKVVLGWFIGIAQNSLQASIDEFLTGKNDEQHNYSYMLEDYPVLPTIMDELFGYLKDTSSVKEQVIANWRGIIKNL